VADEKVDHTQAQEIIRFQIAYNRRRIKSTWALAVIIAVIFFLEEYFGGSLNVVVLVRMGANVSERVKDGEYYRLMSSVFLHAGFMHIFFNTYVLFALGGFFNRILGESKYLVVFLFSGICGSLTSVYFGKSSISVGASGAIWGLFGASLALAIFKSTLLPETVRLRLRRLTLINLLINLGISFLPMIDFWAHIGGGVGGFFTSWLIIFCPRSKYLNNLIMYGFRLAAFLLSVIYLVNFAYGLYVFKPWVNQIKSELKSIELKDVPFFMNAPLGLKHISGSKNTKTSSYYIFGDPQIDTLVIEAHFFHQSILGQPADEKWLSAQRQELLSTTSIPQEVKKTVYFRDAPSGAVLYYQQTPKDRDIIIHNYVITQNQYAIKLGLIVSEKTLQSEVDDMADKIIASIRKK
jgi:membrane associated rhomboid family serine protease